MVEPVYPRLIFSRRYSYFPEGKGGRITSCMRALVMPPLLHVTRSAATCLRRQLSQSPCWVQVQPEAARMQLMIMKAVLVEMPVVMMTIALAAEQTKPHLRTTCMVASACRMLMSIGAQAGDG